MVADAVHHVPVDGLIVVDGDVAKSDRFLHAAGQGRADQADAGEGFERLRHRIWHGDVPAGDQVGGQINGKLNGAGEIQGNDVLGIDIAYQAFGVDRALFLHPEQAAP